METKLRGKTGGGSSILFSRRAAGSGVEAVESPEFLIEIRRVSLHLVGLLEEGLGGDSKELSRILGSVVSQHFALFPSSGAQRLKVMAENLRPGPIILVCPELGGSVEGVVGDIEDMGKLVQGRVQAVSRILDAGEDGGPGEHDGAPGVRFTEDHAGIIRVLVGKGIDDDFTQSIVIVEIQMEDEASRRCRDDHADIIGDLHSPSTCKLLLPGEDFDAVQERLSQISRQLPEKRDMALEVRNPLRRKGAPQQARSAPVPDPSKHDDSIAESRKNPHHSQKELKVPYLQAFILIERRSEQMILAVRFVKDVLD